MQAHTQYSRFLQCIQHPHLNKQALACALITNSLVQIFLIIYSVLPLSVVCRAIFGGRVLSGVGVGILSTVVPLYNAEIAPKKLRGRLVSLNQLAITAGIMVSDFRLL